MTAGQKSEKSVIFIHGCDLKTSNSAEFNHMFAAYVNMGYDVVSVDMPVYGKSEGK